MRSFAEVERDYLRSKWVPGFEWTRCDAPSPINLPAVPVQRATVALVVTAGVYMPASQAPFARRRLGDPSYRELPGDVALDALALSHVGYDTERAAADINVVLPLERLRELAAAGRIGAVAPRHVSFMGYALEIDALIASAREVAAALGEDGVDLVLLAPT